MSRFTSLRHRNLFKVAAGYVVVAWLAIQVVETIFPAFGFGDDAIRVTVVLFVLGAIPALLIAWALEARRPGAAERTEIDRSDAESDEREKSIVVLPFVDMSPEADQEYFSDGISEELLNLLTKIPNLRVVSRTSAFSYKGKPTKLADIARELDVSHILEGSVRKSGNDLRITAQLIEARTDNHLWSDTFDRTLSNVFAIQDEIALKVVEQLRIELLGAAPRIEETDPAAYALFLRARYLRRQTSAESLSQSEELLAQVLGIDATYLPAIDDLISVYINQAHAGLRPFSETYDRARELTVGGIELDPTSGRLKLQLAWIQLFHDNDLEGAARSFQDALELTPADPAAIGDTATFLLVIGRMDESIAVGAHALKLDPVHPVAAANQANALYYAGRIPEAIEHYRTALRLSPDYGGAHYYLALAMFESDPEAALEELTAEPTESLRLAGQSLVHHAMGDTERADAELHTLTERFADTAALRIALLHTCRGQADAAFEWIATAEREGDSELTEIHVHPLFRSLHDDPRWRDLLARQHQLPEQLARISFDPAILATL